MLEDLVNCKGLNYYTNREYNFNAYLLHKTFHSLETMCWDLIIKVSPHVFYNMRKCWVHWILRNFIFNKIGLLWKKFENRI